MANILLVDDDITFSLMLKTWLNKRNFMTDCCSSVSDAKKKIEKKDYQLILSDLRLPDQDGSNLLEWIKNKELNIPIIVLTSYAEVQTAVQCIKMGALDFIAKPINPEILLKKIQEALQTEVENVSQDDTIKKINTAYIKGNSPGSKKLYEYIDLVAPTNMSILITGESGTGKEYIANLIHQKSNRHDAPFVAVDCGAIPRELAGSEFFGHIKGSFTGAFTDKTGQFMAANGGTLFLDEIGNLPYDIQIQLLRALQEKKIKPIGSNVEIKVDVRVIVATNEDLRKSLLENKFREDLYHRINEFSIRVPSLRERKEDIILFANHFLNQSNQELNKNIIGFDEETINLFLHYNWPGNLRQMKNAIKRATLLCSEKLISIDLLPFELLNPESDNNIVSSALHDEEYEKSQILKALNECNYNKSQAAQLLKIDRKTLYNKLKQYSIEL